MNKKQIRKNFLSKRQSLSKNEILIKSKIINEKIFGLINNLSGIQCVGLFYPFKKEVEVLGLCPLLEEKKIKVGLPVVENKISPLDFRIFSYQDNNVVKGYKDIPEPIHSPSVKPDLIVASCTAFSEDGYRVGYGGGFYDRTIKKLREKNKNFFTILAAFDMQICDINFKEEFDQKVDYICTENKKIRT